MHHNITARICIAGHNNGKPGLPVYIYPGKCARSAAGMSKAGCIKNPALRLSFQVYQLISSIHYFIAFLLFSLLFPSTIFPNRLTMLFLPVSQAPVVKFLSYSLYHLLLHNFRQDCPAILHYQDAVLR
jgi:hypothetical protein